MKDVVINNFVAPDNGYAMPAKDSVLWVAINAYGGDEWAADAAYMRMGPYNFCKKIGIIGLANVEDFAVAWMSFANAAGINRY